MKQELLESHLDLAYDFCQFYINEICENDIEKGYVIKIRDLLNDAQYYCSMMQKPSICKRCSNFLVKNSYDITDDGIVFQCLGFDSGLESPRYEESCPFFEEFEEEK